MEPGANKGIQQTVPDLSSVMGFFGTQIQQEVWNGDEYTPTVTCLA